MANIINGTDTGSGGLITTGDSSDELQLQTAETTAVTIDSSQNVGIGTSSPSAKLHVQGNLRSANAGNTVHTELRLDGVYATGTGLYLLAPSGEPVVFYANDIERARITSSGNVGIGTITPDRKLVVLDSVDDNLPAAVITKTALTGANSGLQVHTNEASASGGSFGFRVTSGSTYDSPSNEIIRVNQHGLCFNGDTTAADALDDYEEGTWTPSFTLDSGSATASSNTGSYVKIGKQVSVTLTITFSVPSAADINDITGLPFTVANLSQRGAGAIRENGVTGFTWLLRANSNATSANIRRYDNAQALTNGFQFIGTLTYFV